MNELIEFSLDTENGEKNYALAQWYENQGHTAPAHTYYLRAAERTEDNILVYSSLIRASFCYKSQGSRDATEKVLLENALNFLPQRPEAYYFLSLLYERKQEWQNAYTYANLGLQQEDVKPIIPEFQGNHLLIFQKAVSSWWWGKGDECRSLLSDLHKKYWDVLDEKHKILVKENCKKVGLNIEHYTSIPVLGVPIVNGVNWIKRLIESIDYPVKDLLIVNNNGKGEIDDELDNIKYSNNNNNFVEKITILNLPSNIGVGGAWNLIIKCYLNSPYWIIANNDIAFTPGLLKKMYEESVNTDSGMIHAKKSDWGGGSYDLFLIKDFVIQKCGLFDENLYPAYEEDIDYHIRVMNENIKCSFLEFNYFHGETQHYSQSGSQTWRIDNSLKNKLDISREINKTEYLIKKWGDNYHQLKTYSRPFNIDNYNSSYTTYDLNFVRKKHLGF